MTLRILLEVPITSANLKNGANHSFSNLRINTKLIAPEALQVIKRLNKENFEAYLVGGCVRDLLLAKQPKDFDVVTNATPEQIRQIFKHSRIIGRRFKIVHVVFAKTKIEVATYRQNSEENNQKQLTSENGMLLNDNQYGQSVEEDSSRRDYTINALYYNPYQNVTLDFTNGIYDIVHGNIEIIGDPETRFREDPVRMIRAYRFAAKLGFNITKRTKKLLPTLLPLLKEVPPARMFEEFNKLFLTGHGEQSFDLLLKNDVLKYLLTEQGPLLQDPKFAKFIKCALKSSDDRHKEGKRNMPHFLFAVMLWPLVYKLYTKMLTIDKYAINNTPEEIMAQAANIVLKRQCQITMLPIRAIDDIINIWTLVVSLENQDNLNRPEDFVWLEVYRAAQDFLALRQNLDPEFGELHKKWLEAYEFLVPPEMRNRKSINKLRKENEMKNSKKNDRKRSNRKFRRSKPSKRAAESSYFSK